MCFKNINFILFNSLYSFIICTFHSILKITTAHIAGFKNYLTKDSIKLTKVSLKRTTKSK